MLRSLCLNWFANYKLLLQNYIHSVGRATQAGRCGLAISLVSQCEVEKYIKIEKLIGRLRTFPCLCCELLTAGEYFDAYCMLLNICSGKDFPEFPSFSKEEAVRTFEIVTQAKRKAVMVMLLLHIHFFLI